MRTVIADTSVIMDMFFVHRPNHTIAARLAALFIERNVVCRLPMHGFFEISSAVMCEKRVHGSLAGKGTSQINEKSPLSLDPIPIDQAFINKYMQDTMPDLKSGDMIYVAMARVDELPLITEDRKMRNEATRMGVFCLTAEECIAELEKRTT